MDSQIELPLDVAYRHLREKLRNLGFLIRVIDIDESQNAQGQIVFSVTTHPANKDIEFYCLSAESRYSTKIKELDYPGGRWFQWILNIWRPPMLRREIFEELIYPSA